MTAGRSPDRTLAPDTGGSAARQPTSRRGRADQAKADTPHRVRDLDGGLKVERLLDCWGDLKQDAASGVEGVTGQRSAENRQANGAALVARRTQQRSRAQWLRRRYMAMGHGQERP